MEKRKQFLYALIASAVVTALIGAGILRRVDRWAQDWMFQKPGATSPESVNRVNAERYLAARETMQQWKRWQRIRTKSPL